MGSMSARSVVVVVAVAIILAGCVEENGPVAEAAEETPLDPDVSADPSAGEVSLPQPEWTPVEVPFAVDGEAPSGIWICSGIQTTGQCVSHVIADNTFVIELPHTGAVIGLSATLTFAPVTPNIPGMMLMVHAGTQTDSPLLGFVEGQSGIQITITDVMVNATDVLSVMSWPMPDVDAAGPNWINPLAQPFHVEGMITQLREAE